MCAQDAEPHIKRQFTCRAKSAGLWRVTAPGMPYDEALARKQNMIVVAHEGAAAWCALCAGVLRADCGA